MFIFPASSINSLFSNLEPVIRKISELEKYPHPRSAKALQAIGNRWGTVSGFSVAEAFSLVRSLED